ncbi:hypothetical protein BLS_006717 [Venturia inaequalis]|uniref:Uncharacterized protein n=1 Tax=Venturia inaequalis TaxID=5025 RepID=A0A8H3VB21_VENIN|nr:hypothetical protein BLS_006717 [Venturia inaequalis]
MRDRLNEEPFRISDAAIGAVVGFMCHDIFGDRVEHWLQHREGIITMISLRGGIDTINSNKQLRVSVSWVDIRGAYVYDVRCQFPMPPSAWGCALEDCAGLLHRPSSDNIILKALRRRGAQLTTFTDILADLIDCSVATNGGGWTQNIIHRLLSYRPLIEAAENEYLIPNAQEACRLGALLYIAPIWRKFGAAPVVTTVLVRKLLAQILVAPMDWGELGLLRAWVLAVGALEAENGHVFRKFTEMLAQHLIERHVLSWEQIFPSLEAVIWMKESLAGAEGRLSEAINHLLQHDL